MQDLYILDRQITLPDRRIVHLEYIQGLFFHLTFYSLSTFIINAVQINTFLTNRYMVEYSSL